MGIIKKSFIIKQKPARCDVFVGACLESIIVDYCKKQKASKYVIVADDIVRGLYGEKLKEKMVSAGLDTILVSFRHGEASKTRETKAFIEDKMLEAKCGRDCILIALGGGVVGDLAGFVAGTYMRGVPCMQVPTTTMAQSDSSYGGKTAVDVPAGKNLIGVFKQPIAVFVDSNYLKTLDQKNYASGLVEAVKHGLIMDKKLYQAFKKNLETILDRKGEKFGQIIGDLMIGSMLIKRRIVIEDEKEENLRKILNYGHTIGHAIEKLSNYSLLHGEAIAIGICVEAFLASEQGILSKKDFNEQKELFEKMGLSTKIPREITAKNIIDSMRLDKKARNSAPEFSLIKKIGQYATFEGGKTTKSFNAEDLEKIIEEYKKL